MRRSACSETSRSWAVSARIRVAERPGASMGRAPVIGQQPSRHSPSRSPLARKGATSSRRRSTHVADRARYGAEGHGEDSYPSNRRLAERGPRGNTDRPYATRRGVRLAGAQASAASASLPSSAAELHRPRDALCLRPREVGRVPGRAVAVHVEAARRVRGEVEQASCGRPGLLARRVELHEEEGDAAVAVLRVGAREDDDPVGPRAEGGPHLLAAQHEVVAVRAYRGLERGEVAARPRLAEALAPDLVAREHGLDEAAALRLAAVVDERGAEEPDAEDVENGWRVGARQLGLHDRLLDLGAAAAATPLGPVHAEVAGLVELLSASRGAARSGSSRWRAGR